MEKAGEVVTGHKDAVVLVEHNQMATFRKHLAKLNKKAAAFGLDPIQIIESKVLSYTYVDRHVETSGGMATLKELVPAREGDSIDNLVLVNRIHIEYPLIKLGSWQVVGKLEAIGRENLSFTIGRDSRDAEVVAENALKPIVCEHCKKRRSRKDGFVLRDIEAGQYMQVGKSCLKDFTGIDPAAALFMARMSDLVSYWGDELAEYAGSGNYNAMCSRAYLANVCFLADHDGFISAAKAKESEIPLTPTYFTAAHMDDLLRDDRDLRKAFHSTRDACLAHADEIRVWVDSLAGRSEFDRNVKLILAGDVIELERKRLAFAAAAVPMYNRQLAKGMQDRQPSQHVGQPGEKMSTAVTIERVITMANPFGPGDTYLVLLRDRQGNKLKWKTASAPEEVVDGKDRQLEASFKIKAHDLYNGISQTSVTHLKVVEWIDAGQTQANDQESFSQSWMGDNLPNCCSAHYKGKL